MLKVQHVPKLAHHLLIVLLVNREQIWKTYERFFHLSGICCISRHS